jgi:hypothetical protein
MIGSPHCLNSDFAFYTHSEHYLNITTHFQISFHIFTAYFASLQLIRTSEAHFRNFGPISDLRRLFRKLRTYFRPPKIISETSDLFQTSEDYFRNFAPLNLIFPPSDAFGPFIRTIHISPDLVSSFFIFSFPCRYVLSVV